MIDLKEFKGFAILKQDSSFEYKTIHLSCMDTNIPILKLDHNKLCPIDYVPCGSVEWCLKSLGTPVTPNYYPTWLKDHLHRKVWKSDEWILGEKLFVKPSDKHKRFTGFCTFGTYRKKKKRPYWYSEIVNFTNEWRYYITHGQIVFSEWYYGDEVNTPNAPTLDVNIPDTFSGTLDFGTLDNGKLALVEAHEPFGCGWYGRMENDIYAQWLADGWRYMLLNYKDKNGS